MLSLFLITLGMRTQCALRLNNLRTKCAHYTPSTRSKQFVHFFCACAPRPRGIQVVTKARGVVRVDGLGCNACNGCNGPDVTSNHLKTLLKRRM